MKFRIAGFHREAGLDGGGNGLLGIRIHVKNRFLRIITDSRSVLVCFSFFFVLVVTLN